MIYHSVPQIKCCFSLFALVRLTVIVVNVVIQFQKCWSLFSFHLQQFSTLMNCKEQHLSHDWWLSIAVNLRQLKMHVCPAWCLGFVDSCLTNCLSMDYCAHKQSLWCDRNKRLFFIVVLWRRRIKRNKIERVLCRSREVSGLLLLKLLAQPISWDLSSAFIVILILSNLIK